jgi:hypothetical protein
MVVYLAAAWRASFRRSEVLTKTPLVRPSSSTAPQMRAWPHASARRPLGSPAPHVRSGFHWPAAPWAPKTEGVFVAAIEYGVERHEQKRLQPLLDEWLGGSDGNGGRSRSGEGVHLQIEFLWSREHPASEFPGESPKSISDHEALYPRSEPHRIQSRRHGLHAPQST